MLRRCARGFASALSVHRAVALVAGGGSGGDRAAGGTEHVKMGETLSRLRRAIFDNLIMNGAVFLCSIFLVEWLVQPGLAYLSSSASAFYGVGETAQAITAGLGQFVYHALWLLPLYLICLVMNGAHVAEIAEHSFKLLRDRGHNTAAASSVPSSARLSNSTSSIATSDSNSSMGFAPASAAPPFPNTSSSIAEAPIGEFLGDVFYDTVVVMTCFGTVGCVDLVTAASPWICHRVADLCVMVGSEPLDHLFRHQISTVLPILGTSVSFVYVCWLYSFWAFNARWKFEGIGIVARLRKIETDWAYFLGFGAPLAAATFTNPFFINAAVYALAFPWLVILASGADTTVTRNRTTTTLSRIHIFRVSKIVFERLRRWVIAPMSSGGKGAGKSK